MFFVILIHQKNIYANSNSALDSDTTGFFLVSDNLHHNFKSVDIFQSFLLDIELTKKSSGYWKINNGILNDIDYIKMIIRAINDFLISNT